MSVGSTSSTAAPASKRLISRRSVSSASNRSSSLCRSSADRDDGGVEVRPGVVDQVAGHPDRRERGPQLVGHVRDEPLLEAREVLHLGDLLLDARGHLVERGRQRREVVLALRGHPLPERTGREPLGDVGRTAHRGDDEAGHDVGDPTEQQHQRHATEEQEPAHQRERVALAGHRVDEVEPVVTRPRDGDLLADDPGGHRVRLTGQRDQDDLHLLDGRVLTDLATQLLGYRVGVHLARPDGRQDVALSRVVGAPDEDDVAAPLGPCCVLHEVAGRLEQARPPRGPCRCRRTAAACGWPGARPRPMRSPGGPRRGRRRRAGRGRSRRRRGRWCRAPWSPSRRGTAATGATGDASIPRRGRLRGVPCSGCAAPWRRRWRAARPAPPASVPSAWWRSWRAHPRIRTGRPCSRRPGRSRRSRGAPGPSRPCCATAGRGR